MSYYYGKYGCVLINVINPNNSDSDSDSVCLTSTELNPIAHARQIDSDSNSDS